MTLLPILYWIILILSCIGYYSPGPNPQTWGYRIAGGAYTILFIIIGLRIFRIPL
jgi:hypothetical protein